MLDPTEPDGTLVALVRCIVGLDPVCPVAPLDRGTELVHAPAPEVKSAIVHTHCQQYHHRHDYDQTSYTDLRTWLRQP